MILYHGGVSGLAPGSIIRPHTPPVVDDCPICKARASGVVCTVEQWRTWVMGLRIPIDRRIDLVNTTMGYPGSAPMDAPARPDRVYMTPVKAYARWYAACRSHGDLYEVEPRGGMGQLERSEEDSIETYTAPIAVVRRVVERTVHLSHEDRLALAAQWSQADAEGR